MKQHNSRVTSPSPLSAIIMDGLGWSTLRYNNFQFESGLRYVRYIIRGHFPDGGYHRFVRRVVQNKLFWDWWNAQFDRRNEAIRYYALQASRQELETAFEREHEPEKVTVQPPSHLWRSISEEICAESLENTSYDTQKTPEQYPARKAPAHA